jgi:hypothetical protein
MKSSNKSEYVLTVVQHTFCKDCVWLKNKITDVYHASGMIRGEDSQYWRVQIISPPWEREARYRDFPRGFKTVDVPAVKLEIDKRLAFATQNSALISALLATLKGLLISRQTNAQIGEQLSKMVEEWVDTPGAASCELDPSQVEPLVSV